MRAAFEPAALSDGSLSYYGFGWSLDKAGPFNKMSHRGSWVGFRTVLSRDVEKDELLVMLTNDVGGVEISELHRAFVAAVAEREVLDK